MERAQASTATASSGPSSSRLSSLTTLKVSKLNLIPPGSVTTLKVMRIGILTENLESCHASELRVQIYPLAYSWSIGFPSKCACRGSLHLRVPSTLLPMHQYARAHSHQRASREAENGTGVPREI